MVYAIGYTVCIFVCVLALMVADKDAVKEVDGHYTWDYVGLWLCGCMWPLVLVILLCEIFDDLMRRAVVINTTHREKLKKDQEQTLDREKLKKDQEQTLDREKLKKERMHESNIFYE